jgi:hypothetical protein
MSVDLLHALCDRLEALIDRLEAAIEQMEPQEPLPGPVKTDDDDA